VITFSLVSCKLTNEKLTKQVKNIFFILVALVDDFIDLMKGEKKGD
jgi:hypothetical protein